VNKTNRRAGGKALAKIKDSGIMGVVLTDNGYWYHGKF
jgi:hypothetical protein